MFPVNFKRELDLGVGDDRDIRIILDRLESVLRAHHAKIIERTSDSIYFEGSTFRSMFVFFNVMQLLDHGRIQIIKNTRMNLRYEFSYFQAAIFHGLIITGMLVLGMLIRSWQLFLIGCFFGVLCVGGYFINSLRLEEKMKDAVFIT